MRTFRDEHGRDWTLALTVDAVKRVKALAGVDLMRLDQVVDGVPVVQRLVVDVVTICDVAFAILKPQADDRGVSDEQFAAGLGGDGIRVLSQALMEEITDFFRKLGRTEAVAMLHQATRFVAAMIAATEARVEAIDLASILGNAPMKSPESSESTPAP